MPVDVRGKPYFTAVMRVIFVLVFLLAIGCGACARKSPNWPTGGDPKPAKAGTKTDSGLSLVPQSLLVGKVVKVNSTARFVVINFPLGRMPAIGQGLSVYRTGLKQGELRITGPQLDDNIIADLSAGDARPGDDVREK
jgi:hypothetical protein